MFQHGIRTSKKFARIFERTTYHWRSLNRYAKRGETPPQDFHRKVVMTWARECLRAMEVELEVTGKVSDSPVLLLGNHLSYVDIPVLMSQTDVVFIAKSQLRSWPVFGKAITISGAVYVDRDSKDSRKNVGTQVAPLILEKKKQVTIFPSGTTSMDESKPWRWKPFQIAHEYGIPVQPFRIAYRPLRRTAFIQEDLFFTHLWNLMRLNRIEAFLDFHEPVQVTHPERDAAYWQNWAQAGLNARL